MKYSDTALAALGVYGHSLFVSCLLDFNELYAVATTQVAIGGDDVPFFTQLYNVQIGHYISPTLSLPLGINTDESSDMIQPWSSDCDQWSCLTALSYLISIGKPRLVMSELPANIDPRNILWLPVNGLLLILDCNMTPLQCKDRSVIRLFGQPSINLDPDIYVAGRACF